MLGASGSHQRPSFSGLDENAGAAGRAAGPLVTSLRLKGSPSEIRPPADHHVSDHAWRTIGAPCSMRSATVRSSDRAPRSLLTISSLGTRSGRPQPPLSRSDLVLWHEAGGYCGTASLLKMLRTRNARGQFVSPMIRSVGSRPPAARPGVVLCCRLRWCRACQGIRSKPPRFKRERLG
jgi:hypothetical protein